MLNIAMTKEIIIKFIKDYIDTSGASGVAIGISGGVDSAVAAGLSVEALGKERVLGLILPCESNEKDMHDADLLCDFLGIEKKVVDLTNTYNEFLRDNMETKKTNLSFCNIKPRLRMTTLYFQAGLRNYLVLGTSNKSELITGYLTKYGDGGVDIEPMADLLKHEVYDLARLLSIPQPIIDKKPTADLIPGQTDEGEMGFSYHELDRFIETGEAEEEVREKILVLYKKSRHKINGPVMFKLDRKFHIE